MNQFRYFSLLATGTLNENIPYIAIQTNVGPNSDEK